jgi:hypothetical protein
MLCRNMVMCYYFLKLCRVKIDIYFHISLFYELFFYIFKLILFVTGKTADVTGFQYVNLSQIVIAKKTLP